MRLSSLTFVIASLAVLTLSGCGASAGALGVALPTAQQVGGKLLVQFGLGAEGGAQPSVIKRADGSWLAVYAGTQLGQRHLYAASSTDGKRWSKPQAIVAAKYSDQAPALVEDAEGVAHLFFSSNRDGDDFALFHTRLTDGAWEAAERVEGFDSVQELAVAYREGRFVIAVEAMGQGLLCADSVDGLSWGTPEKLADSGFEPSVAFGPAGETMVAYSRRNEICLRTRAAGGEWKAEAVAATGSDRLKEPALAWIGDHASLIYAEKSGATYRLHERRGDASLRFREGEALPSLPGDARSPSIVVVDGSMGLAWGMKTTSGQQGVALALPE